MSQILGTNVSAIVVPNDTADTFATHDAQYGRGGYRSVATLDGLDPIVGIPVARRSVGMRVKVLGDDGMGYSGREFVLGDDLASWTAQAANSEIRVPPLVQGIYPATDGTNALATGLTAFAQTPFLETGYLGFASFFWNAPDPAGVLCIVAINTDGTVRLVSQQAQALVAGLNTVRWGARILAGQFFAVFSPAAGARYSAVSPNTGVFYTTGLPGTATSGASSKTANAGITLRLGWTIESDSVARVHAAEDVAAAQAVTQAATADALTGSGHNIGTYPAVSGTQALGTNLTVLSILPVGYDGKLAGVSVDANASTTATLCLVSDNGDGTVTIQDQASVTLTAGINTITSWNPPVQAAWYIGVYSAQAIKYTPTSGVTLRYTTGLPGISTTISTAAGTKPMLGVSVLNGEVNRAKAVEAKIRSDLLAQISGQALAIANNAGQSIVQGITPPVAGTGHAGGPFSYINYAQPISSGGYLSQVRFYSSTANPTYVFVVSVSGGVATVQAMVPVNATVGLNIITLNMRVQAGWYVGIYSKSAGTSTIDYYAATGQTLWSSSGLVGNGVVGGTSAIAVSNVGLALELEWTVVSGIQGETLAAVAAETKVQANIDGTTATAGLYPATVLANVLAVGYTAYSEVPVSAAGAVTSVSCYMGAAGSGSLVIASKDASNNFTLLASKTVTFAAGVNTFSWSIAVPQGAYVGVFNATGGPSYAGNTGTVPYYHLGLPGSSTAGTVFTNEKFGIGYQLVSGAQRVAALEVKINAQDPTVNGFGLLLGAGADNTGATDSTAVFVVSRAAHEAPYVPPGNYWVTTLPYGGDGFWGPGKIYVGANLATGVRHLIPYQPTQNSLLLRFRAKLARLIGSGSPLTYVTDSLGEGEFYPSSLARHWGNQIEDFANWAYAPGSEPGCVILRTRTAQSGDSGCNASWFGLTVSGTTAGTTGPVGKSAVLASGDSISFTGAYASIDVFYQQATGAGSLTFAYNGTTYKTISAAGSAANDIYSGTISRTGTTTAGSRTITGLAATADLEVGAQISGAGIPAGSTITTIDSASQITISGFANAGASTTLTILTPSLTGQTASGTYTITATGGPVELTGLLRRAARTSSTTARGLRVHRCGYGGYSAATYTNALLDSIIAQSLAMGPSPRYVIELGTNDWLFGSDILNQTGVTNATNVISGLAVTYGLRIGDPITGGSIPSGAYVTAILSNTSVQISNAATASGSPNLAFAIGKQRQMLANSFRMITRLQLQGQAESVWWISPTRPNPTSSSVMPYTTEGDFDTFIGLIDQICTAAGAKHIVVSDKAAYELGWIYSDGIHWRDLEQDFVADRIVGEMS